LFRVLALAQIVRQQFELRCQTPKPLRSIIHRCTKIAGCRLAVHTAFAVI
jgi:hypothetical protein